MSRFKFFVPGASVSKGTDKDGNVRMRIGGIASTPDMDADEEFLDPNGFDLSYFLDNGYVNWNHMSKTDPSMIIGEPVVATVRNNTLYIETELYPESENAKKVYDLAKTLENSSSSRRLGFSIEGKVEERDPSDSRYVRRAKITGVAITPQPKNYKSFANIIKGEIDDDDDVATFDVSNSSVVNGGQQTILDVCKPNGDRIVVDSNFNIKIVTNTEKSLSTSSGSALIPESVDGNTKSNEALLQEKEKQSTFSRKLSKAETYLELFKITGPDLDKAETLLKAILLTTKVSSLQMSKSNITTTPQLSVDDIQKALDLLNSLNSNSPAKSLLVKGEEDDEGEEEMSMKALSKMCKDLQSTVTGLEDKISKMSHSKMEKGDDGEEEDDDEDGENQEGGEQEEEDDDVEKAIRTSMLIKGIEARLLNQQDSLEDSLQELQKGLLDQVEKISKAVGRMDRRISAVESQPNARKSAMSTKRYMVKGEGDFDTDTVTLSASQDRPKVLSVLNQLSGIEKGGEINPLYSDAVMLYEASGEISHGVKRDLAAKGIEIIS